MLRVWLEELKNNNNMKRACCLSDSMIDEFIKELDDASIPLKTFQIYYPVSVPESPIGVVVSRYTDNGVIYRPTCVRKVGNEWWIGSYYTSIAKFDENFSYLGKVGFYGNPISNPNRYQYTYSFCVNPEQDIYIVTCYAFHVVKCFRISDNSLVWTAGDGSPGNVSDGHLYNPYDVDFLPNGNIIVSCYNGIGRLQDGTTGTGPGHITEIDVSSGNIIASRVINVNGGYPWHGGIGNPTRARVFGDRIYISSMSRDVVGVWDVNTWEYITVYTKPREIDIGDLNILGIYVDDTENEIVLSLAGPRKIAALGLDDHDIKWISGELCWDDRSNAENKPGVILQPSDLYKFSDNSYLVCDYGNNRVTVIHKSPYIEVQYNLDQIPEGYEILEDFLPDNFDLNTGIRKYKLHEYIPNEPLLVPIRKYCVQP